MLRATELLLRVNGRETQQRLVLRHPALRQLIGATGPIEIAPAPSLLPAHQRLGPGNRRVLFFRPFTDAGADVLTVHQEACVHLHRTVDRIRELGAKAGVSINPTTPVAALDEVLPFVDLVLIMSVNPGFAGQRFIRTSTAKIAAVRRALAERGMVATDVEVDGGIAPDTVPEVVAAGATVLVAGAAVFNADRSVRENLSALRRAAEGSAASEV